jgi:hypothetical protein
MRYPNGTPEACSLQQEDRKMYRSLFTPSSIPEIPDPGPLLLFIQQAQLALVYRRERLD